MTPKPVMQTPGCQMKPTEGAKWWQKVVRWSMFLLSLDMDLR